MALNDISLTAGMRSNLVNLQSTVDLLSRTQNRLATGKKVNTALDNPTAYFAAQALDSRASDIDALKSDMGQAIQTIQAADKGIKGISALIEQARGIAQQAQSAGTGVADDTVTLTLNNVSTGDSVVIAGQTLTAGPSAVVTSYDSFTATFALANTLETGDSINVGGVTFTASIGGTGSGTTFIATASDVTTAGNFKAAVDAYFGTSFNTATNVLGATTEIVITPGTAGLTANTVTADTADANEIAISSATSTSAGALANNEFVATGNNTVDAVNIANLFNTSANAGIAALVTQGWSLSADNGVITVTKGLGTTAAADVTLANTTPSDASIVEALVAGATATTELAALQTSYNDILTQIDDMATDSGYKGKNLLNADTLSVKFEGTHKLDVVGFDASTTGLNITAATWTTGGSISGDVDMLAAALTSMRTNSSAMSSNLSIITTRMNFSTDMINVLTEGSGKLTLADTNEEGANMLMLQTRQSLSTTALSLASQAAQSVLRLFG